MKKLAKVIYEQFIKVHKESHHSWNHNEKVIYPYLTYDFESESIEQNVEGFYIDISMFDYSKSYSSLFELEDNLKTHFNDLKILNEDIYVRFSFTRSNKVLTNNENLIRRDMQLYCKVDWRNKYE